MEELLKTWLLKLAQKIYWLKSYARSAAECRGYTDFTTILHQRLLEKTMGESLYIILLSCSFSSMKQSPILIVQSYTLYYLHIIRTTLEHFHHPTLYNL